MTEYIEEGLFPPLDNVLADVGEQETFLPVGHPDWFKPYNLVFVIRENKDGEDVLNETLRVVAVHKDGIEVVRGIGFHGPRPITTEDVLFVFGSTR